MTVVKITQLHCLITLRNQTLLFAHVPLWSLHTLCKNFIVIRRACVSLSSVFQVEVYKSHVYGSVTFHKIKNEIYSRILDTQRKKQNTSKTWEFTSSYKRSLPAPTVTQEPPYLLT